MTNVVERNGEIPYPEWRNREYKKLQIRAQLAATEEEMDEITKKIHHLKTIDKRMSAIRSVQTGTRLCKVEIL